MQNPEVHSDVRHRCQGHTERAVSVEWIGMARVSHVCTALLAFVLSSACLADTVTMTSGRVVDGVVLREDSSAVTVALNYGTITLPRTVVQRIEKAPKPAIPVPAPAAASPRPAAVAKPRIPSWLTTVKALTAQPWATDFHQIPATVIDAGVMKNVPYQSFRCGPGGDYEVNVYGDPDAPAAVEIGIYRGLLKENAAKENCVNLITAILGDATDAAILKLLDRRKDLVVRNGLSIEITPETAEDAYGGWWVSVYDEAALDNVRATPKEIEQITVQRSEPIVAKAAGRTPEPAPRPAVASARQANADDDLSGWSNGDFRYSRPPKIRSSSGGRVYVRSYFRKDGTYVRSHTRWSSRR